MKECSVCGELKDEIEFNKCQLKCKLCQWRYVKEWQIDNKERYQENKRKWRKNNKEKIKNVAKIYYLENCEKIKQRTKNRYKNHRKECMENSNIRRRKKLYNISQEQYLSLIKQQNGMCAICKKEFDIPSVDHDHNSGKVRGILCRTCNRAIGLFKDNISIIENAAEYLKSAKNFDVYYG